jgi:peptide/nickel transport system substrate-binding protein
VLRRQTIVIGLASIIVIVGLAFVAFNTATETRPESGGTYVEAIAGNPIYINPVLSQFTDVDKDLVALIFSGLTRRTADGTIEPDLAVSWEVQDEGRVYLFRLREGVFWHDDQPFSADDVLYTIRIIQDPDFQGSPDLSDFWRGITAEWIDARTIKFSLKEPFAPLPSYTTLGILPKHIFQDVPVRRLADTPFKGKPIGTGPYRMLEATVDSVLLEANPRYYLQPPYLSRLKLNFYPDYRSTVNALKQGEVQGVSYVLPEDYKSLKDSGDFNVYQAPSSSGTFLLLNNQLSIFKDKAVRQALAYALNRPKLVELAVGGLGVVSDSPIVPKSWAYDPSVETYKYNVDTAKKLLDDAGWKLNADGIRERNGEKLAFILITNNEDQRRIQLAQEVAAQWKVIGVQVEPQAAGYTGLVRDFLVPRKFEAAIFGLDLGYDPDAFSLWHSSQIANETGLNFAGYSNVRVDELLELGRRPPDRNKRLEYYKEFQKIFVEDIPSIPIYYRVYTFAVDRKIRNVQPPLIYEVSDRFENITGWYMRTKRVLRTEPVAVSNR